MKLSKKLFLIQVTFFILLMSGVVLTIIIFVLPEVRKIETQKHLDSLSRVEQALTNELEHLAVMAVDWGEWDDTYNYSISPNTTYESSNLPLATLADLEIDLLLILNKQNNVVWKMTSDALSNDETISPLFLNRWNAQHPLLQHPTEIATQGIFLTKAGPLLIARQRILNSQGEGPAQGYLFFAKKLSQSLTNKIADKIATPFSTKVVTSSELVPSLTFIDNNQTHAQSSIPLINSDNQVIQIDIFQARPFYLQALNAITYSLVAILLIGIISCLVTYFLLKNILINPIVLLQKQAEMFKKHDGNQPFKLLKRSDELGQLSSSFVSMAKDLSKDWGKLQQEKKDYRDASYTDVLTGLKNRRYLEDYLQAPNTWVYDDEWAFFTIDLDHFKAINDRYGHDVGDITLQQFSELLKKSCRDKDIIIRSGGEEFIVLCHQTSSDMATIIAERLRHEVENFNFGRENHFKITCSIGLFIIQIYSREYGLKHWNSMLKVSDLALYAAKNNGRNTWVGLECLEECSEGVYPKEGIDIQRWLSEKKLKLLTLNKSPEEFCW
ncbi:MULTISPECIES: diguanylate cyclase [unclassified Neptuniibacter]|uniref:diguanylate cyclase n=1 Tax=unclassified Neptuniibacter TaxID=2630693 RepID=UPI0025E5D508|nr:MULTISPECIES: diguanylate cyclase [unclassified Neptuniibacter]|tara:strand:- start:256 stop:1914 length:1659 start_codon:yes stop_codon:yes gene_type:complete